MNCFLCGTPGAECQSADHGSRRKVGRHFRGFKLEKNSNYPDGTRLVFGASEIALQSDEWFNHTEVAALFTAFLYGSDLPAFINWRDVSDILSSRS